MAGDPYSWNAVVIGSWNTAILSPDGVRKRLFKLEAATPIELEVPLDKPGPFRVGYGGLVVIPSASSLEVTSKTPNADTLKRACELCQVALQALPETPVSAAGVNVRHRFAELPDKVIDLVRTSLDDELSDADLSVRGTSTRRSVKLDPGSANVSITQNANDSGGVVQVNFHLESASVGELSSWIGRHEEFLTLYARIASILGTNL